MMNYIATRSRPIQVSFPKNISLMQRKTISNMTRLITQIKHSDHLVAFNNQTHQKKEKEKENTDELFKQEKMHLKRNIKAA